MDSENNEVETTFTPVTSDIDFLTTQIGHEAEAIGIDGTVIPFGFFIRHEGNVIAGCNGCIVFGGIYTDQLWCHPEHRKKGNAKKLMTKVHELGRQKKCSIAYLSTMSFQEAEEFYHKLGYDTDFTREGFVGQSKMIFLKKQL